MDSCLLTVQQYPRWGCLRKVGSKDGSRGPGRVLVVALPTHPGGVPGLVLTQTGTEKKAKAMAALGLLFPVRKCLESECCHWLARKQKVPNQTPAQMTGGAREGKWVSMLGHRPGVLGRAWGVTPPTSANLNSSSVPKSQLLEWRSHI